MANFGTSLFKWKKETSFDFGTRCIVHENRQKSSISVLFWRFFECFGNLLSGSSANPDNLISRGNHVWLWIIATFWNWFCSPCTAFGGFSGCLSVWEPSLIYTFLEIQPFLLLTLCNKLKEEMGSFVHTPLINEQVLHNFEKVVIDRNRCSELGWIYTKWASKKYKY